MSELDFLKDAKPVSVAFQKSSRGRQPGVNPTDEFVVQTFNTGKPLAFEVPGGKARAFERALRRAAKAGTRDWKMSVQVLDVYPDENAKPENIIPLRALETMTDESPDVWISFLASKPDAKPAKSETVSTDAPADPFAATPDGETKSDATDGETATPATAPAAATVGKTPAVRKSAK